MWSPAFGPVFLSLPHAHPLRTATALGQGAKEVKKRDDSDGESEFAYVWDVQVERDEAVAKVIKKYAKDQGWKRVYSERSLGCVFACSSERATPAPPRRHSPRQRAPCT